MTYTWQHGKQLASMCKTGETVTFEYNEDGLRTKKTSTSLGETIYTLHGKNVVHMTQGGHDLHFYYDAQGKPGIVLFDGTPYAYLYNLQGDVIALANAAGAIVCSYGYDAWGVPVTRSGSMAGSGTVGFIQPFRYRGYVWDEETGLYYLRSRYYRPSWGRFVSADSFIIGNLYGYCNNSPICGYDPLGLTTITFPSYRPRIAMEEIGQGLGGAGGGLIIADTVVNGAKAFWNWLRSIVQPRDVANEIVIDTTIEDQQHQAYFELNPDDFVPYGLVKREFDGTSNGKIIKWFDSHKRMIFEWDEDLKNGSHYHILTHNGPHYQPGTPVPEPYNSLYFGR